MQSTPFAALYSRLTAETDVTTSTGIAYAPHPRQKLDIYRPTDHPERGPIVVFYYGGSWTSGDRAIYGFAGAALASRGITTVIPDYRLHPEVGFPTFVDDAARAYGWVARNLATGCGEPRPIIVMGHSAGAHIAALLALDRSYLDRAAMGLPRPAGLIGMAGPYVFDPTTWPTTRDIFKSTAAMPDRARPLAFAAAHAPATLLMHGASDDVVTPEASRGLMQALHSKGVRTTRIEYPGVGHIGLVLSLSRPFRWRADTLDATVDFVTQLSADTKSTPCRTR